MSADQDNGGPAFPVAYEHSEATCEQHGMSLRDRFAIAALPPVMYICCSDELEGDESQPDMFARKAYEVADAMLRARKP